MKPKPKAVTKRSHHSIMLGLDKPGVYTTVSLIPAVNILGLQIHFYIGGSVIIESIFRLPGIGHFFFEALIRRDYPVVQSIHMIVATFTLVLNLIVDFSYAYLNPRIRYR